MELLGKKIKKRRENVSTNIYDITLYEYENGEMKEKRKEIKVSNRQGKRQRLTEYL